MTLGALVMAGQASFTTSGPTSYVVRSGDSLWAIATAHHLTVSQLAAANGLVPGRILLIGTHLVIPASGSAAATATSGSSSALDGDGDTDGDTSDATTAATTAAATTAERRRDARIRVWGGA